MVGIKLTPLKDLPGSATGWMGHLVLDLVNHGWMGHLVLDLVNHDIVSILLKQKYNLNRNIIY